MPRRPRIAVIAAEHPAALMAGLAALAERPLVQRFTRLYEDVVEVRQLDPDALFVAEDACDTDDSAALRLLARLLPATGIVLLASPGREVERRAMAEAVGAQLLVSRPGLGELGTALRAAMRAERAPLRDAMLDLAGGLSDEINNPLMIALGHLQLLESELDARGAGDLMPSARAVGDGLRRIEAVMKRLALLGEAGQRSPDGGVSDLAGVATAIAAEIAAAPDATPVALRVEAGASLPVQGDRELLEALLRHLARVGAELAAAGTGAALELDRAAPDLCRVALVLDASHLPDWRLPRSFAPYSLRHVLRGSPHGLSLFLAQTIAEAHGGRALARRDEQGRVRLELELPAAAAD